MKKTRTPSGQRGFTLLIAALISSIVLTLGSAVFSIAQKELILSSAGRNSQFAFYAADTAAECALYWDVRFAYFGTSSPPGVTPVCDGQNLSATLKPGDDRATGNYTMNFSYAPNGLCANVSVSKTKNAVTGVSTSTIHSDGYSAKGTDAATCAASIQNDPQVLQRSVELKY